jgi:ssDNA-binding Zn-finger/Zn-ribbon topoisomerase 1
MKPTIKELEEIKNKRTSEAKRIDLALTLRVCPECGADLKMKMSGRFLLFSKLYDVCSANEQHFKEEKYSEKKI